MVDIKDQKIMVLSKIQVYINALDKDLVINSRYIIIDIFITITNLRSDAMEIGTRRLLQ